jgi:CheY-like chemotaxis protein
MSILSPGSSIREVESETMAKIPFDSTTVLIIEADADARETLAQLLQLHGYMVIAAGSDQEALDELQTSANSPAVVVVDLDTPGADWHEFLERLRDEGDIGNPKIIVVSGSDPRVIPEAAAVLPKPVEVPELLGLLHQLLRSADANGQEN